MCRRSTVKSPWVPFQYPIKRLIHRSFVSKFRDLSLELLDRSEIWQAHRQHCCRCACQISKRCDNFNNQSRGFETSRDPTFVRLIGYQNRTLVTIPYTHPSPQRSPKVTGMVMNHWFKSCRYRWIGPPIPEIWLFKILIMNIQGQVRGCDLCAKSHSSAKTQSICSFIVSNHLDQQLFRYSNFEILHESPRSKS